MQPFPVSTLSNQNSVLSNDVQNVFTCSKTMFASHHILNSILNPENPAASVRTLRKHLKANTIKDSYYLCQNWTAVKIVGLFNTHVSFRCFRNPRNLYKEPMKSKNLDIFRSDGLEAKQNNLAISELKLVGQCWVISMSRGYCVLPFLHQA